MFRLLLYSKHQKLRSSFKTSDITYGGLKHGYSLIILIDDFQNLQ